MPHRNDHTVAYHTLPRKVDTDSFCGPIHTTRIRNLSCGFCRQADRHQSHWDTPPAYGEGLLLMIRTGCVIV